MWLRRLGDFVKFLEGTERRGEWIEIGQLVGDLAELLGIDGKFLGTRHDRPTHDPTKLESPLGHHVFGFDRRPGDG